jgi:endonuclease-3 related protein
LKDSNPAPFDTLNKDKLKTYNFSYTQPNKRCVANKVFRIYQILYDYYGRQNWWPADSRLEVIIGAILAQNTAWRNVEKAISNLKKRKLINLKKLSQLSHSELGKLIRASGFYNIKAKRLQAIINFLIDKYSGKIDLLKKEQLSVLRNNLLSVNGIGEETADSILLYGLDKPVFVIDAYTKRIFSRHHLIDTKSQYRDVQKFITNNLPKSVKVYQEYHALLVRLAKEYCRTKPICNNCPIKAL